MKRSVILEELLQSHQHVDLTRKSRVIYLAFRISSNLSCFECFGEFCRQVPSAFSALRYMDQVQSREV
jgi:hypothetical protein